MGKAVGLRGQCTAIWGKPTGCSRQRRRCQWETDVQGHACWKGTAQRVEQGLERHREKSVEASDGGRDSRGLPGHRVQEWRVIKSAVTKGQLNVKLLAMAAESTSPVPPDKRMGGARLRRTECKASAIHSPQPVIERLVNPKREWREKQVPES